MRARLSHQIAMQEHAPAPEAASQKCLLVPSCKLLLCQASAAGKKRGHSATSGLKLHAEVTQSLPLLDSVGHHTRLNEHTVSKAGCEA